MKLYLIQHALSKSKEEDPERGITDTGKEETEKSAQYFKSLNPEIHVIWQSGKKRAKETAEIFARVLGLDNRIVCLERQSEDWRINWIISPETVRS